VKFTLYSGNAAPNPCRVPFPAIVPLTDVSCTLLTTTEVGWLYCTVNSSEYVAGEIGDPPHVPETSDEVPE
jgi:hypothetical protein